MDPAQIGTLRGGALRAGAAWWPDLFRGLEGDGAVGEPVGAGGVTLQILADFRSAHEAAPAPLTLPGDALVFSPDPVSARPWHPDHFTDAFRDLANSLGVTKR